MAVSRGVVRSLVHDGAFPHPAGCRQCHREHRCDRCGNSKGYGPKAHVRHGLGRCGPATTVNAEDVAREVEHAIERTSAWLFRRLTVTRPQRPAGGACGFASIDEFRAFALSEATAALNGSPNIGQLLRIELAVRTLYAPLALLCATVERTQPDHT